MNPSAAFVAWFVAILLWVYLCPVLLIGTIVCMPYFILITPILLCISVSTVYFLKDSIVEAGLIRSIVNDMPYEEWFGHIDRVGTLPTPHLITSHPHGVLCTGVLFAVHLRKNSNTVFAVSQWLIAIPVIGWLAAQIGCIPASEESIRRALQSCSVILVPGGVPELVCNEPYTRRHGFLRIARDANVPILPIKTLGTYFTVIDAPFKRVRRWIAKTYGIPIMLPVLGWYGTWIPKRRPIKLDVKKPFHVDSDDIEMERVRYYQLLE